MDKRVLSIVILVIIIVILSVLIYKSQGLERAYKSEVSSALKQIKTSGSSIVTEKDIKDLPQPVQKYLRYTGVVGEEKVRNFRIVGSEEFKTAPNRVWVKANSKQYNFVDNPERIYFMKLHMFGLPVIGLHSYKNAEAAMKIKAVGLVTVADAKGGIMDKSETVTVFNDMCIGAPATLIDKRIQWETIDPLRVRAAFNNNGVTISAELLFNEEGELINFISEDRYMTTTGETYQNAPWSTPVRDYKYYNGIKLASYGEAYWSLPEGDYCYAKINFEKIEYNLKSFK